MTRKYWIIIGIILFVVVGFNYNQNRIKKQRMLNVESLYKTYPTREEASKLFKEWIIPLLEEYEYEILFPNLSSKDLAIALNILFITETSIKEGDGNWYVAHSLLFYQNSLFGVKDSNGKPHPTWEEEKGKRKDIIDKFAYYENINECVYQWFIFISTPRYELARQSSSWSELILQLKAAGYMTDTQYPNKATNIYNSTLKEIYKN